MSPIGRRCLGSVLVEQVAQHHIEPLAVVFLELWTLVIQLDGGRGAGYENGFIAILLHLAAGERHVINAFKEFLHRFAWELEVFGPINAPHTPIARVGQSYPYRCRCAAPCRASSHDFLSNLS